MATKHVSLRLDEDLVRELERESSRTGQSLSQIVRALIEEGLRMEHHPGIVFRSGPAGRRAGLAQGPDVWEVASVLRALKGDTEDVLKNASELTGQPVRLLRIALHYYAEFQTEIDDWIRSNDEEAERAEAIWLKEQELIRR
jgi:hypothetical protein